MLNVNVIKMYFGLSSTEVQNPPQLERVEYQRYGLRFTGEIIAVSYKAVAPKHSKAGWMYLVKPDGRNLEHWVNEADILYSLTRVG